MSKPDPSLTPKPRSSERPTQKTIAQMTGLAVATVSRALADAPDIGARTKQRVRDVAQQIGYSPDRAGVRLRTGKTNVISLVISTEHDLMNHTARLISSVAAELRGTPYHMIITPSFAGEDPMVPVRYVVETRSADALILNQTEPQDARIAYLMKHNFPFVTHGRTDWSDQHPYFDFDNAAFSRLAVKELHQQKRRNILMVLPPMQQNYAQHMQNGAWQMAKELGLSVRALDTATSDDSIRVATQAIREDLIARPETDGIICAASGAAVSASIAAEEAGRVIGQDIDIAAKEAIPFLQQFRQPILTLSEDVERAGRFLAQAALQRIAEPTKPPMQDLDVPLEFSPPV